MELRRRFPQPPPGTTSVLFRMLFPQEDQRRKYDMQERRLAQSLTKVLGMCDKPDGRGANLKNWANSSSGAACLGDVADDYVGPQTVEDINILLDELASKSSFSISSLRATAVSARSRNDILRDAYSSIGPYEAAVLTQIILKDLRPILYPIWNMTTFEALVEFNTNALHVLSLHEAMRVWDPSCTLLNCYRVQSTLEDAIHLSETTNSRDFYPRLNIPIQIPKCIKGLGCANALSHFKSDASVWAEVKYDGERMQIHVIVDEEGRSEITIFSKSKRDSTLDRIATHWIIREALGLPQRDLTRVPVRAASRSKEAITSIIVEGEMVAYDKNTGIDEFWRIRELVESTAYGARSRNRQSRAETQYKERLNLLPSDAEGHLAIVFFDILFLNGRSLLFDVYSTRRSVLERVICTIPQYAFIARREEITLSAVNSIASGLKKLQQTFTSCITNHEEGLVLKASDGKYADWRSAWVKLKKDYIPGYGDSVDLAIVGAVWEKERGRDLRVPTATFTTFYIGVLSNEPVSETKPHFEVYFTVSYGLNRKQLEELDFLVKSTSPVEFISTEDIEKLAFTFHVSSNLEDPSVVLSTPLLVEIFGAGFVKSGNAEFYEPRFPRISKVYRAGDRSWHEGISPYPSIPPIIIMSGSP
ncbi:hypothetical protein DFH11DRAFT_1690667 [Phellopilus nigrolimitatus]|nr:hypothetical protein DFH11DRAFT_1690667 [Phellopilus nigrolimitatus]